MKKKYFIYFIFFILIYPYTSKGQDINWIRNDSIKYDVVFSDGIFQTPKDYIYPTNLTVIKKQSLDSINYNQWLILLADTNTDWAANLLLYYMYQKDAFLFVINTDRKKWLHDKKDDDEYWKENLPNKPLPIGIRAPDKKIVQQVDTTSAYAPRKVLKK